MFRRKCLDAAVILLLIALIDGPGVKRCAEAEGTGSDALNVVKVDSVDRSLVQAYDSASSIAKDTFLVIAASCMLIVALAFAWFLCSWAQSLDKNEENSETLPKHNVPLNPSPISHTINIHFPTAAIQPTNEKIAVVPNEKIVQMEIPVDVAAKEPNKEPVKAVD